MDRSRWEEAAPIFESIDEINGYIETINNATSLRRLAAINETSLPEEILAEVKGLVRGHFTRMLEGLHREVEKI